jgi:hypothetical protein
VNRVDASTGTGRIREKAGDLFPAVFFVPADPCVLRYEPSVKPVVDRGCPVMEAIERIAGMAEKGDE